MVAKKKATAKKVTKKKAIRFKKGQSGNPKGRPKGITEQKVRLSNKLLTACSDIADKVIEQAKAGDMQAAEIVFRRVIPALANQSEKVDFELDTNAPLSKQIEQIMQAVATGKVAPDTAHKIIEPLAALQQVKLAEEIETRITNLEVVASQ